ncbi:AzlC family ABC transporter permease [Staphylococcus aureus]
MYPNIIGLCRVGISFGIVASSQNFSILEIICLTSCYICRCCAIYYVRVVYSRYTILGIVLTVFIVNSTNVPFKYVACTKLQDIWVLNRVGLGSLVTDETFGLPLHLI